MARTQIGGMSAAFPVVLVIVSAVVYHLAQRSLGGAASPWPVLALAYAVALALAVTLGVLAGDGLPRLPDRADRTAALLIGLGALGVEAGFFLAYRAGWPLASASVLGNMIVTVILATIGVLVFGEQLSPSRGFGIALALLGALLLMRG